MKDRVFVRASDAKPSSNFFTQFQTLFFLTGVPFALILNLMLELPWHRTVIIAIVAGVVLGLLIAHFIRADKKSVPMSNATISARVVEALENMGYRKKSMYNKSIVFVPTWRAGVLSEQIVLNIDQNEVTLYGPRLHVGKILREIKQ